MPVLSELFPQIIPWLFLAITIVLSFTSKKAWLISLGVTLISAVVFSALDLLGLLIILGLLIAAFFGNKLESTLIKNIITSLVVVLCIALAAHLLPGFNNLLILDSVTKSENSIPFSLYLNIDKPFIIFALLLLFPTLLNNKKPLTLLGIDTKTKLASLTFVSFIVIFSLAILASLIKVEPITPSWWWIFALNNLLLTCVAEEVFFRRFIQQKLSQRFTPVIGLVTASLLFGLAHFAGGISYMLIASIAGFVYGLVYCNTGKLWLAILAHLLLNMLHLLLFSYPLVK